MMHPAPLLVLGLSLAAVPAQAPLVESGGTRVSSRVVYAQGVRDPAELYLHHGPATWREGFAAEVHRKAPGRFRLGSGFWACLHTSVEVKLGPRRVPPGVWYLGLQRDAAGDWGLMLMDSSKVMRSGRIAGETRDARPDLSVPLTLAENLPEAAKLSLRFVPKAGTLGGGELILRWGSYRLTTGYQLSLVAVPIPGEPKFRGLDPKRAVTTKTGLQFQELRPGVGALPKATDSVTVRYVGWLEDGATFDSSFRRESPTTFPIAGVIPGWREALLKMRPGAVFLIQVPARLGYGARGVGPVPADADLRFWIERMPEK